MIFRLIWYFQALYASKIISYAQGFMLIREVTQLPPLSTERS